MRTGLLNYIGEQRVLARLVKALIRDETKDVLYVGDALFDMKGKKTGHVNVGLCAKLVKAVVERHGAHLVYSAPEFRTTMLLEGTRERMFAPPQQRRRGGSEWQGEDPDHRPHASMVNKDARGAETKAGKRATTSWGRKQVAVKRCVRACGRADAPSVRVSKGPRLRAMRSASLDGTSPPRTPP